MMAGKGFSAKDMLGRGQQAAHAEVAASDEAAPTLNEERAPATSSQRYRRVAVFLSQEQYAWVRNVALKAQMEDIPISMSDVVRLAVQRLKASRGDVRAAVVAQAWEDVETYPGRAKRGLPEKP